MTEFERIEALRHAHYAASDEVNVETENERQVRLYQSRIDSRDMRDQQCGGGRRIIRKKIGGD